MRLPLLKSWNGVLVHTEKKHSVSGFHVDLTSRRQTKYLSDLLTEERMRGAKAGRNLYAVDGVFPFIAALIDRSLGYAGKRHSTRMSMLHTVMLIGDRFDHRGRAWVRGELMRTQIPEF